MSGSVPPPPAPYAFPAYPGPSYPPPAYRGLPPSKTMATWAIVLALLPMPVGNLVAIGLAIAVLVRCRDGRDHGKTQAIIALVVAPLWLVVAVVLLAVVPSGPERDSTGAVTQPGDVLTGSLKVGDCVPGDLPDGDLGMTTPVTPCNKPHRLEVYATFELPAGAYPGDSTVLRLSEGGCARRFESFAGIALDDSKLQMFYLYPLADTWSNERSVTCIVDAGESTRETLRGAKR